MQFIISALISYKSLVAKVHQVTEMICIFMQISRRKVNGGCAARTALCSWIWADGDIEDKFVFGLDSSADQ